jgi:Tol biopolymer transport system component
MFLGPAVLHAQPPRGESVQPSSEEASKLQGARGKLEGFIVWSTSRNGNHDIYRMHPDGTGAMPLTKSPKTDWYPRVSPDGGRVLFTRSKLDWSSEDDANKFELWDTWVVSADGRGERLLIPNSSWAVWARDGKSIVFSRGKTVFKSAADGSGETILAEGDKDFNGGLAQEPALSDDGKLLALTLRGSERETGILNLETRTWFTSGGGCQFSFFPNSRRVVRVNSTGVGGTQIFAFDLDKDGTHGKISGDRIGGKSIRFMDLPGRRSHEYFPKLSNRGDYLAWAATQYGHDHDLADYEIYLWKINEPWTKAVRLTFHSGNDRWPDVYLE